MERGKARGRLWTRCLTVFAGTVLSACVTATQPGSGADRGAAETLSAAEVAGASALRQVMADHPDLLAPQAAFVRAFYDRRNHRLAWTGPDGITEQGQQVRAVLATAWTDGVTGFAPPAVPPVPSGSTSPETGSWTPARAARHDAALTAALASYVHAALGRRPAWAPPLQNGVLGALEAIADEDPRAERPGRLFRLFDEGDRQARLRRGILRYHALAESGGWPRVPTVGPKLEPGDRHADVVTVRARLGRTGDFDPVAAPVTVDTTMMDDTLVAAVKRFQARHGLAVDGKVGPRTRAAMALPARERVERMVINLRRLRDMPPAPPGRSVEVNIAGATLEGQEDGRTTFRTDVIVGMPDRPTPILRSAINRLVLNPTWTVPTTIAQKDILPRLREDPEYLAKNNFRLFDGWSGDSVELDPAAIDWTAEDVDIRALRLRQSPGWGNALGRIKFLFPNSHAVYLHSTPSRGLFARSTRAFSSGCVRVRDPLDLATFLLDEPETWTPETLRAGMEAGATRTLRPRRSVPLALVYLTAWVDETDTVHFRRDIYGHDAQESQAVANAL